MHTFKDMLEFETDKSKFLTDEANGELATARRLILAEFDRQRAAFIAQHPQLPGAGELYDLASPLNWEMPDHWSSYGYDMKYGTLFGMIISQLNSCLDTSGCVRARLAAIDYIRHSAALKYKIKFA
jgi:hypothetical protein